MTYEINIQKNNNLPFRQDFIWKQEYSILCNSIILTVTWGAKKLNNLERSNHIYNTRSKKSKFKVPVMNKTIEQKSIIPVQLKNIVNFNLYRREF